MVVIKADSITIQENEVELIFNEPDAPKFTCSETFPITIAKGNQKTLTFQTKATEKYIPYTKTVIVKCTNLEVLKVAVFKVYNENAKDKDSVTLDESLGQVTEHNIQFQFTQTGADVPTHRFTGLPITLKAGENKTFTISTDATAKYEPFSKTVTVKVTKTEAPKKQTLHIKTLTIHGKSAASGMVTIPTDKNQVIKDNITLEFLEEGDGVPESRSFSMSPESVSLANAGDKATLTLSTQETEKYNKWELAIEVTREKTGGQEKTIDDCVATLTSQLTWAGIAVDKPISLPATVTGYDNSTVAWTCTDEHVDAATGKIKQDLANITVELQAKVMWKGQEKTVTFNVTVQRLKRIKWITERGQTKIEHVADLSKDGVLLYSEDNKPCLEFEIKNVDVKAYKKRSGECS